MHAKINTQDLEMVSREISIAWNFFNGKKLFITGATGFFGKWILESIYYKMMRDPSFTMDLTFLSRNPSKFLSRYPHLKVFTAVKGRVEDLSQMKGSYDYMIHAATPASDLLNKKRPNQMLTTILEGARSVDKFVSHNRIQKILHTSSGAIYGPQPTETKNITEHYLGGPNPLQASSAYAEGKRIAELILNIGADLGKYEVVHARCFCFAGAYLPLDTHFAFGNFIASAAQNKDVVLHGDGSPIRTYLYAADLVIWMLHILAFGKHSQAYNIGSQEEITIAQLAQKIIHISGSSSRLIIQGKSSSGERNRYVPSTLKAQKELGLKQYTSLHTMISRMISWAKVELNLSEPNTLARHLS